MSDAAFKQAAEDVKKLTQKPSNEDLLALYALFKVATGANFDESPKPGMFDISGKAKYNAWKRLVEEEEPTKEQAQTKYVEKVESLKATHGFDASKAPEAVKS